MSIHTPTRIPPSTPARRIRRPPMADAVSLLHRRLAHIADDLAEAARGLSDSNSAAVMGDVVDRLDKTLVPYVALEESTLSERGPVDPMLHLEHVVIERAVERVRVEAARAPLDLATSRAALARLAIALSDHLRHEREAYLPFVR